MLGVSLRRVEDFSTWDEQSAPAKVQGTSGVLKAPGHISRAQNA